MALLFSTEPSIASTEPLRGATNVRRVPLSSTGGSPPPYISQRSELKRIAMETLTVIKTGGYTAQSIRGDIDYDLRRKIREMKQRTRFYHPNDPKIMRWPASISAVPPPHPGGGSSAIGGGPQNFFYGDGDTADGPGQQGQGTPVYISVFPGTTVEAIRSLMELDVRHADSSSNPPSVVGHIGVLSSGCATHPGGNLRGGSNGQELSLARASTLYASLITDEAKKFYDLKASSSAVNVRHPTFNVPGADTALNTHGMIYTPGVTVFRDDLGQYIPPVDVDIVTCAAVPAQTVHAKYGPAGNSNSTTNSAPFRTQTTQPLDVRQVKALIERTMRERMARVLFLFARRGVGSLILPAFGTGAFANSPTVVARLWAGLLTAPNAPFANVFNRVVFSVLPGPACDEFERVFGRAASGARDDAYVGPSISPTPSSGNSQGPTRTSPMPDADDHEEPEWTDLEQYARALGTSLGARPRDVGDENSSQTLKGKGKQRATCEDADDDTD